VTASVIAICATVYLGMVLGAVPGSHWHRAGGRYRAGGDRGALAGASCSLRTLADPAAPLLVHGDRRAGAAWRFLRLSHEATRWPAAEACSAACGCDRRSRPAFGGLQHVVCLAVAPALIDACARAKCDSPVADKSVSPARASARRKTARHSALIRGCSRGQDPSPVLAGLADCKKFTCGLPFIRSYTSILIVCA